MEMKRQHSPAFEEPQIRVIIACPRSGSMLLMRIFAESADCAITSRLILMDHAGHEKPFRPEYAILENPYEHSVFLKAVELGKRFLICKEELRNYSKKGECLYNICPTPSAYTIYRPVFLVRDPIRVFDSWKNVGWTDIQSLIDYYTNTFRMLDQAPSHAISILLFERLVQDPQMEVRRICARWGVPFSESMLDFKKPFGSSFIFSTDRERAEYCEEKPVDIFTTVKASSSVINSVPVHGLVSNEEKTYIEEQVGRVYLRCWQDDAVRLRGILSEKTWFGFDLDDTLHEFRRASSKATDVVLEAISKQYGTKMPALRDEYSMVLRRKTAGAFSDGKTSFDYRRERFHVLLEHFSLTHDMQFMTVLLETYEANLAASLELKCGALGLLSTIKNMGKRIVIITEGPQDAQDRTVNALGISCYIDFLATTNHFRVSKTDGLFSKVLEHLGISSSDIAYIGDNEQRDIKPATAEGIFSIHFAEEKNVSLTSLPPQINTLRKLQYVLSG
ncbi:hypothetical protein G7046_g9578 [Stylonectria norvegica]|nr:hypothetical protein G7046_g9578 [Stylonectria norvegica]